MTIDRALKRRDALTNLRNFLRQFMPKAAATKFGRDAKYAVLKVDWRASEDEYSLPAY